MKRWCASSWRQAKATARKPWNGDTGPGARSQAGVAELLSELPGLCGSRSGEIAPASPPLPRRSYRWYCREYRFATRAEARSRVQRRGIVLMSRDSSPGERVHRSGSVLVRGSSQGEAVGPAWPHAGPERSRSVGGFSSGRSSYVRCCRWADPGAEWGGRPRPPARIRVPGCLRFIPCTRTRGGGCRGS